MVVTADTADPTGDEVRITRIDALHENVEAAEDHRRAVALQHRPVGEVDLRVDAEAADDPRDRVPRHLLDNDLLFARRLNRRHLVYSLPGLSRRRNHELDDSLTNASDSPSSTSFPYAAIPVPCRTWWRCCACGSSAPSGRRPASGKRMLPDPTCPAP